MSIFDDVRGVSSLDAAQALGIRVKIRGRRGWALCPFHGETGHASLCFYPDSGGWYCFGCHAGGDAVKLYELYLGEEPLEAARTLAQDFGIPISEDDGTLHVNARHLENALERKRKARMLELSEAYLAADEELNRIIHKKCTEDPAVQGFGSTPLESEGFAGAGRGLQAARDCYVGMEASMEDERFFAALRARERAQQELDELTEATVEQLLAWFAAGEANGHEQATGGADQQSGGAGAGSGGGGAGSDPPDESGGTGGSAAARG